MPATQTRCRATGESQMIATAAAGTQTNANIRCGTSSTLTTRAPLQHGGGERTKRPHQECRREVAGQVIHLADERDRGAEDYGTDRDRHVGQVRSSPLCEESAKAVGADNAGEQHAKSRQTRDHRPVGGHEGEEGSGYQQAAHDADHGRHRDAAAHRAERAADRIAGRGSDQTIGLPAGKIAVEPAPILLLEHAMSVPQRNAFVDKAIRR